MKRIVFLVIVLSARLLVSAQPQCPVPFAQFTYTIATDGYTVIFSVDDCNPDYIFNWSFGDGASYYQTGSQPDPTHIYSEEGDYLVTMTVSLPPPCTTTYVHTAVISINHGNPGSMWLSLSGPTLAGKCQQVIFNAQVTGGVPPYIYTWNMGEADCPLCTANCIPRGDFIGNANESATFNPTGFLSNPVCVTVTDANGNSEYKCMEIKVKDFIYPLEININGTKNGTCYVPNSNIVFLPDVDPLSSFEYPTNYFWDFGDGNTKLDNFDGGGVVIHNYATPPDGNETYTVKLTVSDPNGSMQAVQDIMICGYGNNAGEWVLSNGSDENTLAMYYPGKGNPISTNINLQNNSGIPCNNQNVRWKWQFVDESISPVVVLNTMPGTSNPVLFKKCNSNEDLLQHEYGSNYILDLLDNSCGLMATDNNRKHWGCLSVQANAYETTSGSPPNNIGNTCKSVTNSCLIYIVPDELILNDIEISGSCRTFDLLAHVEGGGWKLENGEQKYKNYTWKAFDAYNLDQEIDILLPLPGNPKDKTRIDLDDPYFEQFGPDHYVEFMVKLVVEDYANNIVETNQLISFNPFRLHLQDEYPRCPGVESNFSDKSLATGGSEGPYNYSWTGGLIGENPVFISPLQGSVSYSVTVTDGNCSLNKTTTVNATPMSISMPSTANACSTGGSATIGPSNLAMGGSGKYGFEWTTSNEDHLDYLSDVFSSNPLVQGIPDGQTIIYTLRVGDLTSECEASASIAVTGHENNITLALPAVTTVCYGESILITGTAAPHNDLYYEWTTDHPKKELLQYLGGGPKPQLLFSELMNSYPGTYNINLRATNFNTGCLIEQSGTLTVSPLWKHTGYNSKIQSAVAGDSKPLWETGTNNYITSGLNLSQIEVEWFPYPPSSVTYYGNTQLPSNGTFIPTKEVPYLTMTVFDNVTGCSKSYKTMRYLISQAQPELWLAADNPYFCLNGWICFDLVLDAHLANYQTSLLPEKVTLSIAFDAPADSPQQPDHIHSTVDLKLENSSGMYKGQICEGDFFKSPTTFDPYTIDATTTGLSYNLWGYLNCAMEIDISGHVPAPASITKCLPFFNGSTQRAVKFDFGLQCASNGLVSNDGGGDAVTIASDYIEFHPDGEIEIVPSTSAGNNMGRLFVINPCIVPQLQSPDPDESPIPPITTNREEVIKLTPISTVVTLEVFPNPFTGEVNIQYTLPPECNEEALINLLDITGKHLRTIEKRKSTLGGEFEIIFDGKYLPPGVYFYELAAGNCRKIKKAVKI